MPEKWKRCIAKVTANESVWCVTHKFPFTVDPAGKKCVNPYAVCSKLRKKSDELPTYVLYEGPRGGIYRINHYGMKVYLKQ